MKLVCLNIWGGMRGAALFDYLKEQSKSTDIFCFQEVFRAAFKESPEGFLGRINLFEELEQLLPEFKGYFEQTSQNHDTIKRVEFNVDAGQAVFVNKKFNVVGQNIFPIDAGLGPHAIPSSENLPTLLQNIQLKIGEKILNINNYHGITFPGDKLDSPERLLQSAKILNILAQQQGEKILCGDFNLTINTKSLELLGSIGRDLIKDFKIENTRNEISWKQYDNIQHFADFTFVSSGLKVKSFEVPYNLASDHLPMILEFDV
jgi:Endonuclease/Exonuclease/phosphatase family